MVCDCIFKFILIFREFTKSLFKDSKCLDNEPKWYALKNPNFNPDNNGNGQDVAGSSLNKEIKPLASPILSGKSFKKKLNK